MQSRIQVPHMLLSHAMAQKSPRPTHSCSGYRHICGDHGASPALTLYQEEPKAVFTLRDHLCVIAFHAAPASRQQDPVGNKK